MVKLKLATLPGLPKGKGKKKAVAITATVSIALVAVIVALYYMNPKFKKYVNELFKIGDIKELGPIVDSADTVDFTIPQNRVPPNTFFTITGEFKDKEGKPVRVKTALFYVIQNATGASGPRQMMLQGSIGNNINKFSKEIPTSGFPRGDDYDVIVSDHPIADAELQGMSTSGEGFSVSEKLEQGEGYQPLGGFEEEELPGLGGGGFGLTPGVSGSR
jgi:hypothetical protein